MLMFSLALIRTCNQISYLYLIQTTFFKDTNSHLFMTFVAP